MKTEIAKVISQEKLADGIYSMWIKTSLASDAKAGQFVAIYPKQGDKLLQRPISICEIADDNTALRIVYRVAGSGTLEFSTYKENDDIRLLGPCGNGFDLDYMNADQLAVLVGGGIGVPPMLQLGKELKKQGKKVVFVLGYRNSELFLYEDFKNVSDVIIATDDGSVGTKGTVIDALNEKNLSENIIYSCGPMPMLRGLKKYSQDKNIPAFISLEERMACGVGACLGCVAKTKNKDSHSHVNNARVCVEGPVFNAEDVEI